MKVYPDDLEAALDRQPEIRASCVFGVEGARGPEAMAALIPREPHSDLEAAVRRANAALAPHQHIRQWRVWPESDFPRTSGARKVIKRQVAAAFHTQPEGPAPTPPASAGFLQQQIARIGGAPAQASAASAPSGPSGGAHLPLDSLGRVELMSALEDHYQVELDEAAFTSATTIADIEHMLRHGSTDRTPYPYPVWAQQAPVTWIRALAWRLVLQPIHRLLCRVRVSGREHLHDLRGPVIFVSNHITYLDPALILSALPRQWRPQIAIAMGGERLRDWRYPPAGTNRWMRAFLRLKYALVTALFNVFPLPQESGFRRSFDFAGETADRGYSILIFPEGRLTPDGRLHPFLSGTGLLVKRLNAPVIPVRIDGLFELKQQGRHFAWPGQVAVHFGPPVRFAGSQSPAEIAKELESHVAGLPIRW
jgi:long-chain acyl-CoA synthetase